LRVRLNLATKPLESHRRFLAGSGVVAFVAVLVLALLTWHVYTVRKAATEVRIRTESMRQQLAKYESQRQDLQRFFNQKDIASLHDRAAFLNGIIDARSFNWTQMFMDLEHILPAGVRVISIEPKQSAGHAELKLTFGASSDDAKLKFLHALEQSKEFTEVQEERESTPNPGSNSAGDQKIVLLTTTYLGS
jgi:type IV pilus assembly protein PilN